MPGKYNFELKPKYPHLLGEDIPIWTNFIIQNPDYFDTVDYDIKVGTGVNADVIEDKKYRSYYADLTKKRIDVLGFKNDFITIVEIKKRVSLGTLGQILGYKYLYLTEHPELKIVNILIICSQIDKDDISVLNHYSIPFIVVKLKQTP